MQKSQDEALLKTVNLIESIKKSVDNLKVEIDHIYEAAQNAIKNKGAA